MNHEYDLIGEPVQIRIDHQEGSCKGLDVIVGTLHETVRDQDGEVYWIVEAKPSRPTEDDAKSYLSASHFLIIPKAEGATLERAFADSHDDLPVAIGYFLSEPAIGSDSFDFSQTKYFAIGYLSFLGNRRQRGTTYDS
jgi:hypothetical protein